MSQFGMLRLPFSSHLIELKELIGYWNFNEGDGNELADQSGNGNNGTIYGAIGRGRFDRSLNLF